MSDVEPGGGFTGRRLAGVIALLLAATLLIALGPRFHQAFSLLASGEKVDIGGRELFVHCRGAGSPTVVLEHGLGSNGIEWKAVQERLAEERRVCFTSRAGMGFSDPIPGDEERTAQDAVDDLSGALLAADIAGPYVLVGHSFGGFVVRLFADQHPDAVVAMVLVDSVHEDQVDRLQEGLTPRTWMELAGPFGSDNPERMDFEASGAQAAATGSFGDLPLVVLQAGDQRTDPEKAGISAPAASELDVLMTELWPRLQIDLARLSTSSTRTVVDGSGHFIHIDRPDVVVDAIRSVIETPARSG